MFSFFFSLIASLFIGDWRYFTDLQQIGDRISNPLTGLGILVTSTFNNVTEPMINLSDYFGSMDIIYLVSFVMAVVVTIGVIVAVVNIIKRIFTIFFQGVR